MAGLVVLKRARRILTGSLTPKCTLPFLPFPPFFVSRLIICSDPTNVEKAHQQILAIAPIIPGQTPSSQPPAHDNQPDQPSTGNDLIDFDGDSNAAAATTAPSSAQKDADLLSSNGSTGLMTPLQPSSSTPVKRVDSDMDVFVDAPEK